MLPSSADHGTAAITPGSAPGASTRPKSIQLVGRAGGRRRGGRRCGRGGCCRCCLVYSHGLPRCLSWAGRLLHTLHGSGLWHGRGGWTRCGGAHLGSHFQLPLVGLQACLPFPFLLAPALPLAPLLISFLPNSFLLPPAGFCCLLCCLGCCRCLFRCLFCRRCQPLPVLQGWPEKLAARSSMLLARSHPMALGSDCAPLLLRQRPRTPGGRMMDASVAAVMGRAARWLHLFLDGKHLPSSRPSRLLSVLFSKRPCLRAPPAGAALLLPLLLGPPASSSVSSKLAGKTTQMAVQSSGPG